MTNNSEMWTLEAVLKATGGELLVNGKEQIFPGISTDSRTLRPGELFVALAGENFDGHQFVEEAASKGAGGVVVTLDNAGTLHTKGLRIPVIGVSDTLRAFGDLASYWRGRYSIPVVAITGSNGKTTTKEMVAAILGRSWKVLKNHGTFNNLVGVPLTLLQLDNTHEAAVVEIGMNQPGEIERLTEIVQPNLGMITNIQSAHLEGMGGLDSIQRAKGALFAGMEATGTIVVNRDDPRVSNEAAGFPGRQVRFSSKGNSAEVRLEQVLGVNGNGSSFLLRLAEETLEIHLPVIGLHHIKNAVAAAAVGWALNLPTSTIGAALDNFQPIDKRMEVVTLPGDIHLINDTYNANPGSMAAALETLMQVKQQGRTFAVLGDMLEMGKESSSLHRQVGRIAAKEGVDHLSAMGKQASHLLAGAAEEGMAREQLSEGGDHEEIATLIHGLLVAGDWVLVKGSRGMRMEKVVEILVSKCKEQQDE
jgi:UDP-N-acetylmuramoyl-tripeptide--D-alanyl-D-alanine ligase